MNVRPPSPSDDLPRRLFAGAMLGFVAAAGVILARWITWQPHPALLMRYDLVLVPLVVAATASLGAALPQRLRPGAWASAALAALGLHAATWATSLSGTGAGWGVKGPALALGLAAAVTAAWRLARRGRGLPSGGAVLGSGAALVASLAGFRLWEPLALLHPLALLPLLARGLPREPSGAGRGSRAALASAAALVAVCLFTPAPGSEQQVSTELHCEEKAGPSVILVVLDTLRRDHMSLYGYERPTTPNIDRWAEGGLVFDDAMAVSSWTLPTHASMFTGLYPRSHGAHARRGDRVRTSAIPLGEDHTTLAELAREAGLCTAAILSNWFYLGEAWNLDQGFETYWVPEPRSGARFLPSEWLARRVEPEGYRDLDWIYFRDRLITDEAIRWLDSARGRPFFLVLNYLDPHEPNERPANGVVPPANEERPHGSNVELQLRLMSEPLSEAVRNHLVNEYDRELVHLDHEIGRLFEHLRSSGLDRETTVILTSDHGEYFGEHGLLFHPMHLYREALDVPLVIRGPGIAPGRTSRPAQSPDVFPTVLERLGVAYDRSAAQGVSLFSEADRPRVAELYSSPNPAYREARFKDRFSRDLRVMRWGRWALFEYEDGEVELYDLVRDPAESTNLAGTRAAATREMRERLRRWVAAHRPAAASNGPAPEPLDPEKRNKIRSLGYLQ